MNAKRKAILDRIDTLVESLRKAREYLESGEHADWRGFRPVLVRKAKDGKDLPPHPDWVQNVFIRRTEQELSRAEKALERLDQKQHDRLSDRRR